MDIKLSLKCSINKYYLFIPTALSGFFSMTSPNNRPVAVKLDDETRDRLKQLAETKQRTTHWLMREAIKQYVNHEEQRESLRQDAMQAWEAYQSTGQHVSHQAADAWLKALESGKDIEPPKHKA